LGQLNNAAKELRNVAGEDK